MADLTTIFHQLQRQLFPALTAELGPLSALDQQFCEVMALTDLGRFTRCCEWCGTGCPPHQRTWLAHAFIAKHVYQFTRSGIRHWGGFEDNGSCVAAGFASFMPAVRRARLN